MTSSYQKISDKIQAKLECDPTAQCLTFVEMQYFLRICYLDDIHYNENDEWINYCLVNTNYYNNGDWLYY